MGSDKHIVQYSNRAETSKTHRAGTNPEVLLLDILDTLVYAFVFQHLQRATEWHSWQRLCWMYKMTKEPQHLKFIVQRSFMISGGHKTIILSHILHLFVWGQEKKWNHVLDIRYFMLSAMYGLSNYVKCIQIVLIPSYNAQLHQTFWHYRSQDVYVRNQSCKKT